MSACNAIGCGETASFRIEWGEIANPDNFTEACQDHLASLIGHRPDELAPAHYRVIPLCLPLKPLYSQVCDLLGEAIA